MKRAAKKRRLRRGFTLAETIAAVAVLAILCVAISSGVGATISVYHKTTVSAEASVLLNTLTLAVSDELQYATDISSGGTGDGLYTSAVYGTGARICSTEDGRIAVEKTTVDAGGSTVKTEYRLVSDKTYTSGLSARAEVTYGDVSTVALEILDKDGRTLASSEFSVAALNA